MKPATLDRTVLALCAAASLACAYLFRGLRHDDAYITFRYARNLATGAGFVFNPGERVFGTTSPLFTLLMALAFKVIGDAITSAAITVSALALGVQALVIYRLVRTALPLTAALCAALVLGGLGDSHGYFALETNLAVALGLAAVLAFEAGRSRTSGLLLGLAFLTRYDACLFGLLVAALGFRDLKRLLPCVLVGAAVVLPWLVFATAYFGSPLPHTLDAKRGLMSFRQFVGMYLNQSTQLFGLARLPTRVRLIPLALLGLNGGFVLWRRSRVLLGFVLQAQLLMLAYAFIGAPAGQTWHTYASTLTFRLAIVMGVFGWLEERAVIPQRYLLAAGGLLGALMLSRLPALARAYENDFWLGDRNARYEAVAHYLSDHRIPGERFMATEVGTLGYLTDRRMVDPYGLIDWTNDWPRTQSGPSYAAIVEHYRPDVILLDSVDKAGELASLVPAQHYRVIKVFDWHEPWSTLAVRSP